MDEFRINKSRIHSVYHLVIKPIQTNKEGKNVSAFVASGNGLVHHHNDTPPDCCHPFPSKVYSDGHHAKAPNHLHRSDCASKERHRQAQRKPDKAREYGQFS